MKNAFYLLITLLFVTSCVQKEAFIEQDSINTAEEILAMEARFNCIPTEINYETILPKYLQNLGVIPVPVNNQLAGVGRVLFYDKNLSQNRKIACASCHLPQNAFSDNKAFSLGVSHTLTHRNSQPLANVSSFSAHYLQKDGNSPLLLWDGRAADVRSQSQLAFTNPIEMGMQMSEVVERVREADYYPYLWRSAFGHFEPKEEEILEAIEAFVGTMGSANSNLDKSLELGLGMLDIQNTTRVDTIIRELYYGTITTIDTIAVGLPLLSSAANKGRAIFVANCTKCHSPIRPFQEVFAACNGLDLVYADKGFGSVTHNPADDGVFKSPSLRNIALTAPYMHDGRFKTLREVVDFYSDGVQAHPNLHPLMLRNGDPNLHLSETEKQDLISFLHSMTEHNLGFNGKHNNPFK